MKAFLLRNFDWVLLAFTFILLLLTYNNKSYLFVFLLFGLVLILRGQNLAKTLFYVLLLALPFEKSLRGWHIPIVSSGPLAWMRGYDLFFGLAVKYLASFALLLILLAGRPKIKLVKKDPSIIILFVFLALALVSTIFADRFDIAALGYFRLMFIGWVFLESKYFFQSYTIRGYFRKYIVILLLFLGMIGSLQFIIRQPLGLFLEDQLVVAPFGFVTNESDLIYRVTGLIGHPTFFGSYLSLLVPVGLGIVLQRFSVKRPQINSEQIVTLLAIITGALAIFGTFSRSAWLAIFISLTAFSLAWWKKFGRSVKKTQVLFGLVGGLGVLLASYSSLLLLRLKSFSFVWSLGSGRGRLELIRQSSEMIKSFPIFGVGLNHFTAAMVQQNLSPEARGFLYPVHNTFLLFLSEIGLPAGVLFITLIAVILIKSWRKAKQSLINFGIWIGAFTFLINAQFHTLFNHDPALGMFMVLLAYLSAI